MCAVCVRTVEMISSRCYRCRQPSAGFWVCEGCRPTSSLSAARVAVSYEGLAKDLLWGLKSQSVRAAAEIMADLMVPLVATAHDAWLVPVPTATRRARGRGYDQAKILAKGISRRTRLRYVDCLRRRGQTHQVGASRDARLKQLRNSFRVSGSMPSTQRVILVDDVVTTGATLESAAAALQRVGVSRVEAVAFAQPEVLGDSAAK